MEPKIIYDNQQNPGIPVVGKVAAGTPRFSEEISLGHVVSSRYSPEDKKLFALQIVGDSMIEDGIFNGNYIVCRQTNEFVNGDIVIAYVNEEATVKRIYKRGSKIILQPANAELSPIEVDPQYQSFRVGGKVLEVLRH
ncbi:MAG TPA: transcriptional repressor LexA [bacterium]|nr:transcriptional repressor LexA [bacterium]HMW32877.1 transcriptional repressor LexA [bacterium]HMW35302.1 transcriptional repressor LexA [bacterium]HMY35103.1 transcriptional repressor LexA [bacterium]HMZ04160.1 transcriptional repressor LexA [bacterium]